MLRSLKYDKYGTNYRKNPSSIFRPVGPWERAKTWVKSSENKMFFKFREKFILRSLKYAKIEKYYDKNPSLKFRPVGPFDWPKTWSKTVKIKNSSKFVQNYT